MTTAFAQGQLVRMKIVGFGTTSFEDRTVAKVTDKAVTLKGFKGTFNPLTGEATEPFPDVLIRSIVPHKAAGKPANFRKGQKVDKCLTGAGFTTKEDAKVLKVNKKGVWLDNGPGNDPSGPFDAQTGLYLGASMDGWVLRIAA